MTLRRLPDPLADFEYELKPCLHPEHHPPKMVVLEPGMWEHRCPGCSRTLQFRVPPKPMCAVSP